MANLKRKLRRLQKRKRSSYIPTCRRHEQKSVDTYESVQSSGNDNNDVSDVDMTKSKKYLSVDSAYTSTDLLHECFGVSQNFVINDTDTKTVECEMMDIASHKTSPDNDSICLTKNYEMMSDPHYYKNSKSESFTYPSAYTHKSKCSLTSSEESRKETFRMSECPQKIEINSMDKNKNYTYDSFHHSRTNFGENKTKPGKHLKNTDEVVQSTDTHIQSYGSTRQQSDHQLMCELIQKGIDLNYDNNNEKHINTMQKIQALQLLTEDIEYETDHSVHSHGNTSDDLSDYN